MALELEGEGEGGGCFVVSPAMPAMVAAGLESNFRPLSIRASHPRNVGQIRRVFAVERSERALEMMEQVLMAADCRRGRK